VASKVATKQAVGALQLLQESQAMGMKMMEYMKGAEAREAAMAALLRDAEERQAAQAARLNEMLVLQHQQMAAALAEAEAAKALLAEYMVSETRGTAAVHATFFTPAWDVTTE
jgi:hypothetical protein